MKISLVDSATHYFPLRTRMTFRYGIAELNDLPLGLMILRFRFEPDGPVVAGMASDLLPPKWFKKDPDQPAVEELEEMRRVIDNAVKLAANLTGESPFAFWKQLAVEQRRWAAGEGIPTLLANFGTSLVERAMLDAWCRWKGGSFTELLHDPALGFDAGAIHAELAGRNPSELLPEKPLDAVSVRHTLGFGDPLTEAAISPEERIPDPLPHSLEQAIATYGLTQFKIKIKAVPDEDIDRLESIAAVIAQQGLTDHVISLDGNELFTSWDQFTAFWEHACSRPGLQAFLRRVSFIEQPLSRAVALQQPGIGSLPDGSRTPPVIIDESDAGPEDFETALQLGYRGVSHKNCKGIFKGVAHRMLIEHLNREQGAALIMSGEDLGNIGPVALPQDLALQAILGNGSVERNGHHYFYGLSMFPPQLQQLVLERHPDLYRESAGGVPTLRIEGGKLSTRALVEAPFGTYYTPEELEAALNLR